MTTLDAIGQEAQAQQQQPGGETTPLGPPQPAQAPIPPTETPAQGLAPTGVSQQLTTLNSTLAQQALPLQTIPSGVSGPGGTGPGSQQQQAGSSSTQQLAQRLAQGYGLPIGKDNIVDASGNFLMTPDQMADQSGMRMGEAAAKMNMVSQALARAQTEQQQQKGIAALQTGVGLVQSRGRGSLAAMQSGFYQDLADMYSNQEYAAADFSYFIEAERFERAEALMRRQEKLSKKSSRFGFVGGIVGGIAGFATGNIAMGLQGVNQAAGSAAGTGWF
jgi:hypothetical protein